MIRVLFLLSSLFLATAVFAQEPNPAASKPGASKPAASTVQASALEVSVPAFPNGTCPIMGKKVSEKLFVDTDRGRIYMCCKACTKKILGDVPKAHATAYPVVKKLDPGDCPITGDKVKKDAERVVIQGYSIPVCCEECITEVRENSQIVLAQATNPKNVDIENATCPITGKAVEKNAFCLIGDSLVRLSSPECVEEVKKDPAKVLEKAKTLKAPGDAKPGHGKDDGRGGAGKPKGKPNENEKPKGEEKAKGEHGEGRDHDEHP